MTTVERRVYYPKRRTLIVMVGLVQLGLVGWLLWQMVQDPASGLRIWSVLLSGLVAFFCLAFGFGTRIEMDPHGMSYAQIGLRAYTTWSNIEKLEDVQAGRLSVPVLHLRQPAVISRAWLPSAKREQLLQLPLSMFDLRPAGPLMQGLRQHAPHLFREQGLGARG